MELPERNRQQICCFQTFHLYININIHNIVYKCYEMYVDEQRCRLMQVSFFIFFKHILCHHVLVSDCVEILIYSGFKRLVVILASILFSEE